MMFKILCQLNTLFRKFWFFFFLFFCFFFVIVGFAFQFELILFFFPDILILNLNELYLNESFLSTSNKFNLLKGYIFVDFDFWYKTSLLSSSFGIVKYKKYKRNIRILRTLRSKKRKKKKIYFVPLNKVTKKYKRPLFIRYLFHLSKRTTYFRLLLLRDLFNMSSFSQKLWLFFWEYTERTNINIQKRRIYQRFVTVRNTIHSFPVLKRQRIILAYKTFYDYSGGIKGNSLKNYNYYNIYKKFSKYLYLFLFSERIEPFRFYKLYFQKKKSIGVVPVSFLFNYTELTQKDNFKKIFYDQNTYELTASRTHKYFDYMGFGKRMTEKYSHKWGSARRYRFRFSRFYNEKFLLSNSANTFRKLRVVTKKLHWRFQNINRRPLFDRDHLKYGTRLKMAIDRKSRSTFWKKAYARYGYRKKDYNFYNYDFFFNFKKFYIHLLDDLFVLPKMYKSLTIFDFIMLNFFKLNNFFMLYIFKKDYYINYTDFLIKQYNFNNKLFKNDVFFKPESKFFNFDNINVFTNIFIIIFYICVFLLNFLYFLVLKFFFFFKENLYLLYKFYKTTSFYYFLKHSFIFFFNFLKIYYNLFLNIFNFYKAKFNRYMYFKRQIDMIVKNNYNIWQKIIYRRQKRKNQIYAFIFHILRKITGYKYIKIFIKNCYISFLHLYKFLFYGDTFFFQKIFYSFYDINYIYNIRLYFNLNFLRFFLYKFILIGFFFYIYYYVIFFLWRLMDSEDDVYNWELFVIVFLLFIISINFVCNPHIFINFFN